MRSLTTPVGAMSGGQRQAIAIARAVHWANRVVFLDEPTAALGVRQTANVLDTIRRVRDKGVAVVLISHSMPHVIAGLGPGAGAAPGQPGRDVRDVGHLDGTAGRGHDRSDGRGGMTLQTQDAGAVAVSADDEQLTVVGRLLRLQAFQILLVLVAIVAVFMTLAPNNFGNLENFRQISQNAAILAVLGVGMTFVIITSGIDLSVGSVLVFSGVVAAKVMIWMGPADGSGGQGWGVASAGIAAAVLSGLAWGLLNGVLIAKAKIPPLIVTLGTLGAALGLAQILTDGVDLRTVPTVMQDSIGYGNAFGRLPIIVVIALVVIVIGAVVLHLTRFGRYTYAIGSNEESARRVGVRVDRHLISVYALSGTLAGVRRGPEPRAVRDHGHRRPVPDQPQCDRGRRDRGNLPVRRRRFDLRHGRRALHPRRAAERVRDRRRAALLATGRRRRRAHRRRLRRPDQASRSPTRRIQLTVPTAEPSHNLARGTRRKFMKAPRLTAKNLAIGAAAVVAMSSLAACGAAEDDATATAGPGATTLQDRLRPGRRRRPVLHHDAVRHGGRGQEARRHRGGPGPAEVRPDPAEADRRLGRGLQARRAARGAHRRHRDAGAARRRRPTRASRWSWSTPRSRTRRSRSRRSPPTTSAAARRPSTRSSS